MLVDSKGLWQLVHKKNGTDFSELKTGWFNLKNGTQAAVFRHKSSPKTVLLMCEGQYYILSHPGVEELYRQLLACGVKIYKE